jgi:uncharacterized protein YkwD
VRIRRIGAAVLIAAAIASAGIPSAYATADPESGFRSQISSERSARGSAALASAGDLVGLARAHSVAMAAEGRLWHTMDLPRRVTGCWTLIGENVGMGPSVEDVHAAFMRSASHRANILGTFNLVGVGVTVEESVVYVTEVFAMRKACPARATVTRPRRARTAARAPRAATVAPQPQTVDLLVRMVALDSNAPASPSI